MSRSKPRPWACFVQQVFLSLVCSLEGQRMFYVWRRMGIVIESGSAFCGWFEGVLGGALECAESPRPAWSGDWYLEVGIF